MGLRFQSDKGLQSHYNAKHDWHQSHTNEQHPVIETRVRGTSSPRYALPAAEVVGIAASSSSVSSSETGLNFEHLKEKLDDKAVEQHREQGRNNFYQKNIS